MIELPVVRSRRDFIAMWPPALAATALWLVGCGSGDGAENLAATTASATPALPEPSKTPTVPPPSPTPSPTPQVVLWSAAEVAARQREVLTESSTLLIPDVGSGPPASAIVRPATGEPKGRLAVRIAEIAGDLLSPVAGTMEAYEDPFVRNGEVLSGHRFTVRIDAQRVLRFEIPAAAQLHFSIESSSKKGRVIPQTPVAVGQVLASIGGAKGEQGEVRGMAALIVQDFIPVRYDRDAMRLMTAPDGALVRMMV